MSDRDQPYERVLAIRQRLYELQKEIEELRHLRSRVHDAKELLALAARVGHGGPDSKLLH